MSSTSTCFVAAPAHRIERHVHADGRVALLTALRPELGRPSAWWWQPLAWAGGLNYRALPLHGQMQALPEPLPPLGTPLRWTLPAQLWPARQTLQAHLRPGERVGLLGLAVYRDLRTPQQAGVGVHATGLEQAVAELLTHPSEQWCHGFVLMPEEQQAQAAAGAAVSVAFGACQYPPGLLDASHGWERDPERASPALASLARLHALARHPTLGPELSLLLILGDQIYADATAGLADPDSSLERYAANYQRFKRGPVRLLPPTLARIVHTPDDHEIVDNWEPRLAPDGSVQRGPWVQAAAQAAWDYRWEADAQAQRGASATAQQLWHAFDWRGIAVFACDSRFEREPRRLDTVAHAHMLGQAQRSALAQWLAHSRGRPRLLLTGTLPLPRRVRSAQHPAQALRSDAWCGYPASLHALLGEIWRQRADGLLLLSGDEHRSGWVSFELQALDAGPDAPVVRAASLHSSAFYAPWAFTVTPAHELATPDEWEFQPEPLCSGDAPLPRLRCRVSSWQDHPGDGFALLRWQDHSRTWQLWFDRARAPLHAQASLPTPLAQWHLPPH
ncbi:alkaline phosphatase D family protein [Roseateles sp. BYS180W]|uniref:Alkaline phosphatase D family protein n=1 Tax=Roseateles rivi TaxID=3299028 RepID=A0ABW7FWP4_9BURK